MDKKGVSQSAKDYSAQVTKRFTEFIKGKGMKEVADRVGCNYQALRNSVSGGHNPSLDTLCQVKLGYMEELDMDYLFMGKKTDNDSYREVQPAHEAGSRSNEYIRMMEEQIKELKKDKEFLQGLITKQTLTT